ncbi:MAG TPA: hypothetical protein VMH03_01170, partial [Terriglobales bacterium]|nr:hypothetical protein [Terriglobales bacterium]
GGWCRFFTAAVDPLPVHSVALIVVHLRHGSIDGNLVEVMGRRAPRVETFSSSAKTRPRRDAMNLGVPSASAGKSTARRETWDYS